MGLKILPDVAKSIMDIDLEIYIDDIDIFSSDYDEHMETVIKLDNGLKRIDSKPNH